MPLLSVVMPVYNVEKYVSQAIESVLDQPCKDLELIIVDDGSPEDMKKKLDEYFKNKQLFRLKWYIRGIARRIMRRK